MKTRFGRFVRFTLTLGFALGLGAWQASAQVTGYTYTTNNGAITITGYTGPGGVVIIPATINGMPVANIGQAAFSNASLTSVTIPNSVTGIGDRAFYFCTKLTSVTIPNSVTHIGDAAFANCSSLANFTIPNGVTNIGDGAFSFCNSLTRVTIPNSVTSIGDWAFSSCTSLTSITIPNSVTSIGYVAFLECSSLTNVTIGDSVTYIGLEAFRECTSLTSVTIPNSVSNIGDGAFYYCSSLTSITIPHSVTSIGNYAFSSCTSLTSITIPYSVTSIGAYAFAVCTNLTGIYFEGNAPIAAAPFGESSNVTVYYLPGTTGWGTSFGGRPTARWVRPYPVMLTLAPNFGIKTNAFGFRISWATNTPVVVEASTSLINPSWSPVSTNTLTDGWSYFSDPKWTNYLSRFYRVRSR